MEIPRFGIVVRDSPNEQVDEWANRLPVLLTPLRLAFDGECLILKASWANALRSYALTVTLDSDGRTRSSDIKFPEASPEFRSLLNCSSALLLFPLQEHECHGISLSLVLTAQNPTDSWSVGPTKLSFSGDSKPAEISNPIAAALHHLRRVRRDELKDEHTDKHADEELERSRVQSAARLGKVRNDEPELLIALLRWYTANATQKRRVFVDWFATWSTAELLLLRAIVRGHRDETEHLANDVPGGSQHPFIHKALAWTNLYHTHGEAAFMEPLNEAIEKPMNDGEARDALWATVVAELTSK
jgi:hypothetical protein